MSEAAVTAVLLNRNLGVCGEVAATAGVDIIPEGVANMSFAPPGQSVAERMLLW